MSHRQLGRLNKLQLEKLLMSETSCGYPTKLAIRIVDEIRSRGFSIKTGLGFDEARKRYANHKNNKGGVKCQKQNKTHS